MRLAINIKKSCRPTASRLACIFGAAALYLLSGCTGDINDLGEINSFFDPSEPNIRPLRSAPLVKPILDTLDPASEEPDDQFSNATDILPEDLVPEAGDYRVGKNDLINVAIYDLLGEGTGQSVKTVRVSESGSISLDFIKPVYAVGLTEQELQDTIRQAYEDAGQIKNARVTVTVAEERARTFTIYGNVGSEGQYQILKNDFRLLDALVMGRGPAEAEGVDYCFVIREAKDKIPTAPPSAAPTSTPASPATPATPTTDLLEPPHTQADPSPDAPRYLQTAEPIGSANAASQPAAPSAAAPAAPSSSPLLAPETGATTTPSGVVFEGQAVPTPVPAVTKPAAAEFNSGEPGGLTGFKFNPPNAAEQRIIRVPVKELRNGHFQYNVVIRPGDLIFVPDAVSGEFYMGGHVQRTGPYSLTARKITLKQAVVSAGMFDQAAIPGRSEVIRRVGPNKEVYVRLDLDKIWSGQQPDIYLKPNDIVQVGTNELAPFIAALRNAFRISYGFGFTYDLNFAPNNGNNIP